MTKREEQRTEILNCLNKWMKVAKDKPEHTFHGYFPIYCLQANICKIMGYEVKCDGWRGRHLFYEDVKECQIIISRMEAQGFIKVSKSGQAFKVLKCQ